MRDIRSCASELSLTAKSVIPLLTRMSSAAATGHVISSVSIDWFISINSHAWQREVVDANVRVSVYYEMTDPGLYSRQYLWSQGVSSAIADRHWRREMDRQSASQFVCLSVRPSVRLSVTLSRNDSSTWERSLFWHVSAVSSDWLEVTDMRTSSAWV